MPDACVSLIIADPPYNEGKACWDRVEDYLLWWSKRVDEFHRILKPSGVFYFFQMNIETAMDMHKVCKERGFVLKQMIVVDKGLKSVAGRTSDNLRTFPKATEYLFYYTFLDRTGAQQLSDTYRMINPMAKYLTEEIARSGVPQCELRRLFLSRTGGETGCITNWLKGYNFPLKEQYAAMRKCLNNRGDRPGQYLRREYEYLRREYEDLRHTFNLPYGVTDVWQIDFYADKVSGHETPKPVRLIQRIIDSSTNPGDVVFDPFLGSGTTLLACRITGRLGLGFEIDPKYEPVIVRRTMGEIPQIDRWFDSKVFDGERAGESK